jgi:cell division protein FtsB
LSNTVFSGASKLAPKLYGDKQQIETLNADNDKLKEDIAELQKMLLEQNKKEY